MQDEILLLVQCSTTSAVARTSLCALTFARDLGQKTKAPVSLVVCGLGSAPVPSELLRLGAKEVLVLRDAAGDASSAETICPTLVKLVHSRRARWLVGAATSFGKDLLPRVAEHLDGAFIGDCCRLTEYDGAIAFVRPVYAGNALATCMAKTDVTIISVRQSEFAPVSSECDTPSPMHEVRLETHTAAATRVRFLGFDPVVSERPALEEAKVVVAGGRALSERFFEVLTPLADSLGAAIGATRAACDCGYAPNDSPSGANGKSRRSRSLRGRGHLRGSTTRRRDRSSRVIVAINSDSQAPIFSVADFGLVADLFRAVPELVRALERRKSARS
ncbi:MAG: FAD-binding protein [Polyangiaceae bacterium]